MELDTIGDEKTVLFLIMSDTDTTFNFILAMLQSQLINLLCDRADGGNQLVEVGNLPDVGELVQNQPYMDRQSATVFIIRTDTTFNFILAMLQSQLINLLCDRADDKYGGRLPVHVRLILDEFANIGQIPNFDKLIPPSAAGKSRHPSFCRASRS